MIEEKLTDKVPYYLVHISKKRNINKILETKKFIPSIHDVKNGKIQWLGDGVYFWDSNDTVGKLLGKNLASGKFKTSNIFGIHLKIKINNNNYLNLESKKWADKFTEFLKIFQPDNYKKICDYMEMIQTSKHPSTSLLNKLGEVTGTALNVFIHIIEEESNCNIDMVSQYFYHGKNVESLFQRDDRMIQQFCVRNLELLNKSINNYDIEHIS